MSANANIVVGRITEECENMLQSQVLMIWVKSCLPQLIHTLVPIDINPNIN